MSDVALTQFLVDVTRGRRREAFASNPDAEVAASPLAPELRAAVLARDIGALWLAGAHPMALMYFARAAGWDNERYYGCLEDAELRRAGPAAAAPTAPPAPARTHRSSAPRDR